MNFDDLKDQLIEKIRETLNKVQESESYITLKERYDSLSPNIQKLLQVSLVVFVVYFVYSIPAGFVDSANEKVTYFEDNRKLTRDLIRAGRIARTTTMPPSAPNFSSLKQQVDSAMTQQKVLADQKGNARQAPKVAPPSLVPKSITQTGIKAGAKKLNLRQSILIAEKLSNIKSSRLMNMYMVADGKDPHYYAVDYELASFSVPQKAPKKNNKKNRKNKKNKKSRFKKR